MTPRAPARAAAWRWGKRGLTLAFFGGVAWLLVGHAREIDWHDVGRALLALPPGVVLAAAALGAASHALYSCFDLLGRRYTGHGLRRRSVVLVNFISYAFNLNLGSLIGGFAFRYRLYSKLGLRNGVITRVLAVSMLTNWLGYLVVAGTAFLLWPLVVPEGWGISAEALRMLGGALLAVAAVYLLACARYAGRHWHLRGHRFTVPGWRMACVQLAMSCTNWMLMGAMVWVLLQGQVEYHAVLAVLLVGAFAGVITHVPAGLGVLEAVFVALLAGQVAEGELLAALLAYRGMYYLVPLALATVAYAVTEARGRSRSVTHARRARLGAT